MSWTTLGNGVCPPPPPEGFRWVNAASGLTNQAAIDNSGRLYTWGSANWAYTGQTPVAVPATSYYLPNPLIPTSGYSNWQLRRPTQVGIKSDWIRVDVTHDKYMAIDAQGYIYVWGIVESFIASNNHPDFYDWNNTTQQYEPPGWQALIPTRLDTHTWSSFRLGAYHALLQKADKSLWVWGENLYGNTFGTPTYATGEFTDGPVEMTWIPGPVKLYDADYAASAIITESDQVWIWGTFSDFYNVPTQIPFAVPGGTSIVEVACSNSGVLIRLSDGTVYGWGNNIAFEPSLGTRNSFLLAPGGHTFKQLDCWDTGAFGLHTNGDAYGWGIGVYLLYRPLPGDNECTYQPSSDNPELTAAATSGQHQWDYVCKGGWTHLAIDNQGRLFSWGENAYSELGIGLTEAEYDHACLPIEVLTPVDETGTLVDTATSVGGASVVRIAIVPQLEAHIPCGHWHVKTLESGATLGGYKPPFNCWECTGAVDGVSALVVLNGRFGPNELIFMQYNIQANTWAVKYETAGVTTTSFDAGAALRGDVRAFHGYGYDTVGQRYQETASNPCLRTYVQHGTSMQLKKWPTGPAFHTRNKVAINDSGLVAVIVVDALNIRVEVSTDYGASYTTSQSFPKATFSDANVIIDSIDDMYIAALNYSGSTMLVYRSVNNGASWTLQSTTDVVTDPRVVNFRSDGAKYVATVGGGGGIQFYYSTPGCTAFITRDLQEPSMLYAATNTSFYNLADGTDYFTSNYEASSIVWKPLIEDFLNPTKVDRGTLDNSGMNALYTHSQLRDETIQGPFLAIMISTDLGQVWHLVRTPFNWCTTFQDILEQFEEPWWPFVKQTEKIGAFTPGG